MGMEPAERTEPERPRPVIVVADGGIDSALTLLYALLAPELTVAGIVAAPGAVSAAQAADTALRIVRLCGAEGRVPVAAGEGGALPPLRDREPAAAASRSGPGGALLAPSAQRPLAESAAAFLVRAANEAPGRASLIFAAAPTPWPPALRLDPTAAGKFRAVAVAGGAALVPGDATPVAEACFHAAPEAAACLLATARPLTAAGLDVAHRLRLGRADVERIERLASPARERPVRLLRKLFAAATERPPAAGVPAGALPLRGLAAVLALTAPELFGFREWRAAVETGGGLTAGMVVADRRAVPTAGSGPYVRFCTEVEAERAVERFVRVFTE